MKNKKLFIVLGVLLCIVIVAAVAIPRVTRKAKVKATSVVIEQVVNNNAIAGELLPEAKEVQFETIYNVLDESDKERVDEIIDEYVSPDVAVEVTEMVADGITEEEAKQYVYENINPDDIEYIKFLYEKYYDEVQRVLE